MNSEFTYVILQQRVLLTKKKYNSWREIQDEYYDEFMTSMGPFNVDEFLEYLTDDFKEEENWPFSKEKIMSFVSSNSEVINGR